MRAAYTLVELMTVIVIVALLVVVAIPGYENFVRNTESVVMASRLADSLRIAKAEAIKRGVPVTVCPISSSFNPTTDFDQSTEEWPCQNTSTWDAWKVFTDPNLDATEDFSNGWPIIQYVLNTHPGAVTSNVSGPITFDPMGFANIDPSTTRTGWTWSSSYSSGEWQWGYNYSSAYTGSYSRSFSIIPEGCTGKNARTIDITQNGVVTIAISDC